MHTAIPMRILVWSALSLAVVLLGIGLLRTHPAYSQGTVSFSPSNALSVSERRLVQDATFSGMTTSNGQLISTYDRNVEQGKQPCPT